jgi:hypothetical protein
MFATIEASEEQIEALAVEPLSAIPKRRHSLGLPLYPTPSGS